ncbi:unnamed protein product [Blepharisma stoltei]|uniref:Kinesin-like protein n=1 Tax=Blepharisma stoltei TaxID=1481888 RepID=A0AAU9IIA1_9CILI|nr:unnamed protein product [Blepharisma stoltei]
MDRPKIQVIVRKRPLTASEIKKKETDIVDITSRESLIVREDKQKVDLTKFTEGHNFLYDQVYDETATNQEIYQFCIQPLISAAFEGSHITCFAYGQTGSGKTYTMLGESRVPGLYLLASQDVFERVSANSHKLKILISFYEIYCAKIHDLLNERQQLVAREDANQKVNIVGLMETEVSTVEDLMRIIGFGLSNRVVGVTGANDESSRSHAVLNISLKLGRKLVGKVSFIDLAGSERGADTVDNSKQTRIDGAEINKSLLALKECIRALDQDKKHTPFRGSILTQVLKDSFTGKSKTVMIANISPSSGDVEHTLNTLRYADRVKELKKGNKSPRGVQDILADSLLLPRKPSTVTKVQEKKKPQTAKVNSQPTGANRLLATRSRSSTTEDSLGKYLNPNWRAMNEQDLQEMSETHEKLIAKILNEEEELITSHKQHIDTIVDIVKEEMILLNNVDKPGSDVEDYVGSLNRILERKIEGIRELQAKLNTFSSDINTEGLLSRRFYQFQNEVLDLQGTEENDGAFNDY